RSADGCRASFPPARRAHGGDFARDRRGMKRFTVFAGLPESRCRTHTRDHMLKTMNRPQPQSRPKAVITLRVHRDPLIIRRIDAIPVALPLKAPMKMSGVTIAKAENLLVRIESTNGTVGWGEAASAPTMTGDTLPSLVAAVRDHLAPVLVGQDARPNVDHRPALRRALVGNTGAHSAVEMALLDLAGRACRVPVIDVVVPRRQRGEVAPMWLLGNATPDEDIAEARAKRAEGFGFFKLKIGVK